MTELETEKVVPEKLGKELRCILCGHDHFLKRRGQLSTALLSFLNFPWANPTATCYICGRCGYIHWFL